MVIFKTRHATYTGLISLACNTLPDNDPVIRYAVLYDYRHLRKLQMIKFNDSSSKVCERIFTFLLKYDIVKLFQKETR